MTVILLHPIGIDIDSWRFASFGFPVVTPEWPGHGRRPWDGTPITLDGLADEVAASIQGDLDVIGVSLGGVVTQHLLLRHPDRVRSAVIACAPPKTNREVLNGRAIAAEQQGMSGVLDETIERWFTPEARHDPSHPAIQYTIKVLRTLDREVFAATWRAMARHDLVAQLKSVRAPVTVLGGSRDAAVAPESLDTLASSIPGARKVIIDAPHLAYLEQPGAFVTAVREHLELVSAARP